MTISTAAIKERRMWIERLGAMITVLIELKDNAAGAGDLELARATDALLDLIVKVQGSLIRNALTSLGNSNRVQAIVGTLKTERKALKDIVDDNVSTADELDSTSKIVRKAEGLFNELTDLL